MILTYFLSATVLSTISIEKRSLWDDDVPSDDAVDAVDMNVGDLIVTGQRFDVT